MPPKPMSPTNVSVSTWFSVLLAGLVADAQQEVGHDQPAGREGQREGHVEHRPLGGGHARLAHHRHAVRDGLQARCTCRPRANRRAAARPACPTSPNFGSPSPRVHFLATIAWPRRRRPAGACEPSRRSARSASPGTPGRSASETGPIPSRRGGSSTISDDDGGELGVELQVRLPLGPTGRTGRRPPRRSRR